MKIDTKRFRIKPGSEVDLSAIPTSLDLGIGKDEAEEALRACNERIGKLQEKLYAGQDHAILIVLQGMDAGGKDSTVQHVLSGVNPAGCEVVSFKQPSELELRHDYLWRIHMHAPRKGHITVFNRSHYEDVMIVRVKELVPKPVWKRRYEHIRAFEKLLTDEGTLILKFWLHISKNYQKERLERRLRKPELHWKFNPGDIAERARWDDYQRAAEDAISRTSEDHAPWYVIPGENRPARNLLIANTIVETLESLDLKWPQPDFDPSTIVIE